jgi:hypothetical protein
LGKVSDISISGGDIVVRSIGGASSVSRPASPHSLYFWTLAAIIAAIAAAIMLAFWPESEAQPSQVTETGISCGVESWPYVDLRCRDESAENRRRIRLISTDRIEKAIVNTVAAPIPVSTVAPIDAVEKNAAAAQPVAEDSSAASSPSAVPTEPVEPAAELGTRDVIPKARAQARPRVRARNAEGQPVPAVGARPEKSYTGAGNSFDAVH